MSRIRTIKPEFWTSDQVVACSLPARLLFIGLWNFSDDSGICPATPKRLKMQIFPGDDIDIETLCQWIEELKKQGLLTEYEVDNRCYYQITGWHHQRIDRPTFRFPKADGHIPKLTEFMFPPKKSAQNKKKTPNTANSSSISDSVAASGVVI
ncbi:MAG: hypothetical protein HQL84_09915 [Magnetococcales bacterium]|nr:hypothetical protein [Magnetococcales bacterium]MBF0150346.1 hypothetical protein [Magnetococcales bacterium]MBF0632140.1 hypothetical protein [Magnetococcales bacterium]